MVYLIIIVAILVVVAPIFAILPSKQQKLTMEKRKAAMSQGIGIDLTQIEDPDPDPKKYLSTTGRPLPRNLSVAAYRLSRKKPDSWRRAPDFRWSVQRIKHKPMAPIAKTWFGSLQSDGEFPNELKEFLENNLQRLPEDVVKVEEVNYVLTIYWHELAEVSQIVDFLKACALVSLLPDVPDP